MAAARRAGRDEPIERLVTDAASTRGITDLLAAIVRGDPVANAALASCDPRDFCRSAVRHGLLPLVAERLADGDEVAAPLRSMLRRGAAEAAVADLLRERELKRTLAALDREGVRTLVIKGAHLAYSHYPRPDLRPRFDTDILIPEGARGAARDLLLGLGYEAKGQMSGDLVVFQATYVKRRNGVPSDPLDVHWKIANPQVFANVLSYEELMENAVPLPQLGPTVRGPCDVHAMLVACVHRVAHHLDSDQLIWLYDIDLLARRLGRAEWEAFGGLAGHRKVAGVCRRSLERAAQWFHTDVPAYVWLDPRLSGTTQSEITAGYLAPRRQIVAVLDDLRALPAWSDRWRLLGEHMFPPADYMRAVYAPASRMPLPILYTRRLLRGARKWLKR